jgi:hypothetical protein
VDSTFEDLQKCPIYLELVGRLESHDYIQISHSRMRLVAPCSLGGLPAGTIPSFVTNSRSVFDDR